MKLSALLALLVVASTGFAQTEAQTAAQTVDKSPAVAAVPPQASNTPGTTIVIPERDWSTLPKMSQEELQREMRELQGRIDRANQAGCPVVLTSAGMTPYLMLLRASGGPVTQGGLDLGFRNASGKQIQSIELQAEFLARKSIYDLRTEKLDVHLTAQGTRNIDDALDHLRHLPLPERSHPVVLNRIRLQQVTFTDGSIWTPAPDDACGFSPNRTQQIVSR